MISLCLLVVGAAQAQPPTGVQPPTGAQPRPSAQPERDTAASPPQAPAAPARQSAAPTPVDLAYRNQVLQRAKELRLWERDEWLRLGHYRPSTFGGYESEVDGDNFFVATNGKEDPRAELLATILAFFSERPLALKQGPAQGKADSEYATCRFPARLLWLSKELQLDLRRLPQRACEKFITFVQEMQPQSLTLVFSSYYLNNPASAFGHSLLRVNKAKQADEKHQALLDYGIDFSANVDTNNSIVYAVKGLMGMFPGVYRRVPYYYKVREYNDFESRDLWEYELNLSPAQVITVVAHIWELGPSYFDYYYLSENCSYHILGALEVADPALHLLEHVSWPAVPVDTLRALYKNPGLVRSLHFRPSGRTTVHSRLAEFDDEQVGLVGKLLRDPKADLPVEINKDQEAALLDATLDIADTKYSAELVKKEADRDFEAKETKQALLERRAGLLVRSEPFRLVPEAGQQPHVGHGTRRLLLGSGYGPERGASHELGFRLALHALSDPPPGYPESAEIEFMALRARYFVERSLPWLEELSLVRVTSISPWSRFEWPLAWTVRFGWDRLYDSGCDGCLATTGEVGGGMSLSAFSDGLIFYLMTLTDVAALAPIAGGIADLPLRAGIGPSGGLRLRFSDDLVLLTQGKFMFRPFQNPMRTWQASGQLRYQYTPGAVFGVDASAEPTEQRLLGSSILYF